MDGLGTVRHEGRVTECAAVGSDGTVHVLDLWAKNRPLLSRSRTFSVPSVVNFRTGVLHIVGVALKSRLSHYETRTSTSALPIREMGFPISIGIPLAAICLSIRRLYAGPL